MYSTDINTSDIELYMLKNSDSYIHTEYLEDKIKQLINEKIQERVNEKRIQLSIEGPSIL